MDILKLKRPMMHGPAVVRLQELADMLGFDRGPNDGIFGPDTEDAVEGVQGKLGLKVDGICGPITWKAMRKEADGGVVRMRPPGLPVISDLYDRRGKHPHPRLYKKERDPEVIDAIVLHQCGCKMPSTAKGWDRLNAHIGITRDGDVILVNGFEDWIWHAQGLSQRSIGIEIAGNFPGLMGNDRTLWRGGGGPHTLTQGQVVGLLKAYDFIEDETERLGIKIEHVFAHRQSKDTRMADPGEEIWKKVGQIWQGLFVADDGGDSYSVGSGRRIPREWDSRRTSRYWSR
ncbi:MAG: peptidoglycan-binding protein [Planctomycetota bacterium]|nr:peptidoglycan-binding protein [Planctomycetota bacterium]